VYTSQEENQFILDNQKLIIHIAKKYHPINHTEMEEYIQCGQIGLLRAIRKHKIEKGKLSTIAWKSIRWEISRYITSQKRHKAERLTDIEYSLPSQLDEYIPDSLSSLEETVVSLRRNGYTYPEIASQLNSTDYTVRRILERASEKIRSAN